MKLHGKELCLSGEWRHKFRNIKFHSLICPNMTRVWPKAYKHREQKICMTSENKVTVNSGCRLCSTLSTNLYASLWFWTKDGAEPRWLHRPLQCWFPMILRPKEVVFHDLLFLFMPSPSRYGRKHKGHPCIEKGINMTVLTI